MAALLHDLLEDAGACWAERIGAPCGEAIYRIVCECSDVMPYSGEEKAPWLERKKKYIVHLPDALVLRFTH